MGWGLAGFYPGPALVRAAGGSLPAVVVVLGMTAGMLAEHWSASTFAAPRPSTAETPR
jgi:uncharacterized protein